VRAAPEKVARWTPSPHTEKESLREVQEVARAKRRSFLSVGFLIVSVPISLLLFFLGPMYLPLGVALLGGALKLCIREPGPLREPADAEFEREFRTVGSGRTGWLVKLLVHQGDAPMGSDRGMLWLEDDRLYFAGRRTSFGLTADQVSGLLTFDPATPGVRNDLELRLAHHTPAGPLGISVSPIVPGGRIDTGAYPEVIDRVNRWIGRGATTGGQLPPLDSGPDAPTLTKLSLHATVSTAYWALLALWFPFLLLVHQPLLAVTGAFFGLLLGGLWSPLWSPWLRVRAWHDRRRVLGER
jgi:hypothetical protein